MIKATAVRNPKLINIPSHTPSLNVCATFQRGFITALAVIQSYAPLDKEHKLLPLGSIHVFKLGLGCAAKRG